MMKPKFRQLLERCIEVGIQGGFNKAMKHAEKDVDETTERLIREQIEHYIWLEIDENFDFEYPQDSDE